MNRTRSQRLAVIAASYASLPLLAWLAYMTVHVHIGALAVIPILFISYYVRAPAALLTAFVTGVALGLLDQGAVNRGHLIDFPPVMDALILSTSLCVIVIVANRLREAAAANQVLHGRLIKARRDAEHDSLTGIFNRTYFLARLDEAMSHANAGSSIAVLFSDLDGFKQVNDTSGHLAGDQLLRLAAGRLVNAVRAVDTVARLGGDEFGILVERVHDADEAMQMSHNIERAFIEPFHLQNRRYSVGITVGISLYPDDGNRPETLLRIADARMYRAKHAKRGDVPASRPTPAG
ncbi:MAG TPA: GGDEF domain-containing protein [Candidatus Baltobacteraceae bacterium]|nr:GGDEF domain-containing protein [Candidatus Baltobacteraceae bacterium]